MSGSKTGKKRKTKKEEKHWSFKSPGSHVSQRWVACNNRERRNNGHSLSVCTSVTSSSNQCSEHRSLIFEVQHPLYSPSLLKAV